MAADSGKQWWRPEMKDRKSIVAAAGN